MHPSEPRLTYRPDIDGLRALAVLSVVFFHAEFVGFDGGFVGVDIFFVISGYLITTIIAHSLETKGFSVARFYERRIRRIIPAFIAMVVTTSIAAIAFLPPHELSDFGLSAAAAATFASNIFFSSHTDYFARSENTMPLLHTWSLGVEEQFYIVWPLILFACHRMGSRLGLKVLVVCLAVASLVYSEWSTTTAQAERSFYLPQSRAWELMIGAVLALGIVPGIDSRWLRDALALFGVAMMVLAVTQLSANTSLPGLWAAVPCFGAALVIHTGQKGDTAVSKLLSLRPCLFIGLISYSLYLWHWPIFAFAENYFARPLTLGEALAVTVSSIAIAAASWRYIERPFRYGERNFSQRACFVGGLAALALVAGSGGALFLGDGLPGRLGPETLRFYLASQEVNPLRPDCHTESSVPPPASHCTKPVPKAGRPYDIIVWGDSHGDAVFPGVVVIAEKYGSAARQATRSGCLPLVGVEIVDQRPGRTRHRGCAEFNRAMMEELQQEPRPSLTVLAGRWSLYTETYKDSARRDRRIYLIDDQDQRLDVSTSRQVLSRGLNKTVAAIKALGIQVLLVGQAPDFRQDPNPCFVRKVMYHRDPSDCIRLPRQVADQRLRASKEILVQVLNGGSGITYLGLDEILCDDQACWAKKGDQPLYRDEHHLNVSGARVVGAALSEAQNLKLLFESKGFSAKATIRGVED